MFHKKFVFGITFGITNNNAYGFYKLSQALLTSLLKSLTEDVMAFLSLTISRRQIKQKDSNFIFHKLPFHSEVLYVTRLTRQVTTQQLQI